MEQRLNVWLKRLRKRGLNAILFSTRDGLEIRILNNLGKTIKRIKTGEQASKLYHKETP